MSMFLFVVHYGDNKFPVSKKDYSKIGKKKNICINTWL